MSWKLTAKKTSVASAAQAVSGKVQDCDDLCMSDLLWKPVQDCPETVGHLNCLIDHLLWGSPALLRTPLCPIVGLHTVILPHSGDLFMEVNERVMVTLSMRKKQDLVSDS
jgi:hypothetical protein